MGYRMEWYKNHECYGNKLKSTGKQIMSVSGKALSMDIKKEVALAAIQKLDALESIDSVKAWIKEELKAKGAS